MKSNTGSTFIAEGNASVTDEATQIAPVNARRRCILVRNEEASGGESIRVGTGAVSDTVGFLLLGGEAVNLETVASVYGCAVTAAATVAVSFIETAD